MKVPGLPKSRLQIKLPEKLSFAIADFFFERVKAPMTIMTIMLDSGGKWNDENGGFREFWIQPGGKPDFGDVRTVTPAASLFEM